jgi:hypothetical protein
VLYVYATDSVTPVNFNQELLEAMLVRNPRSLPEPQAGTAPTTF